MATPPPPSSSSLLPRSLCVRAQDMKKLGMGGGIQEGKADSFVSITDQAMNQMEDKRLHQHFRQFADQNGCGLFCFVLHACAGIRMHVMHT